MADLPQTIPFGQENQYDPNWSAPQTIPFGQENQQQTNTPPDTFLGMKQGQDSLPARAVQGIKNIFSSRFQSAKNIAKDTVQNTAPETVPLKLAARETGNAFGAIGDVGNVAMGKVLTPQIQNAVTSPIEGAFSNVGSWLRSTFGPQHIDNLASHLQQTAGHLADNPVVKSIIQASSQTAKNPDVQQGLSAVGDTAQGAGTIVGAKELAGGVSKVAQTVAPKVGEVANAVGEKVGGAVSDVKNAVGSGLQDRYVAQEKANWAKPTESNKAGFKKATAVYENAAGQNHDIPQTLVDNGIRLSDNTENGTYATKETAAQMRADAAKMSTETLRPSLEKADLNGAPKTPVKDVITNAESRIKSNTRITAETKTRLIKNLRETQAALEKAHPDGMKLVDLHDEKITRDANAGYSPVGDIATNMEATKNKAVADAARTLLEKNAPPEIPVHDFNAELTKQYRAADYLDALDTKKVPKTILSRVANTTAKVTGAAVGHGIGGGILGGVGGYHIGGMLETMFENMKNPVREAFLNNLSVTNPEVFQKVKGYLNQ